MRSLGKFHIDNSSWGLCCLDTSDSDTSCCVGVILFFGVRVKGARNKQQLLQLDPDQSNLGSDVLERKETRCNRVM